jgi:hypothetical protein
LLGRDREPRGEQQSEASEGDGAFEPGDTIVERDQHRKRGQHARCRPDDSNGRAFIPALDEESRPCEQDRKRHGEHEMPGNAGRRRLRRQAVAGAGSNQMRRYRIDHPGDDDERRQRGGDRHRAGGGGAAPGDRERRGRQRGKRDGRGGIVVLRHHDDASCRRIDDDRTGRHRVDPARRGGGPVEQAGDDQQRDQREPGHHVEEMRRKRTGVVDSWKSPEQAECQGRDREPAPSSQVCHRESGRRHDREVDVKRPVIRLVRGNEQRRDLGADEAERRQRRPVQQCGAQRHQRDHTEQGEGGRRFEKAVKRIGRSHRRRWFRPR